MKRDMKEDMNQGVNDFINFDEDLYIVEKDS